MAILTGSTGNDTYNGTVGVSDTAVIASTQARTSFSFNGTNWLSSGTAGNDTLVSIEIAQLNDALLTLSLGGEVRPAGAPGGAQESQGQVLALANGNFVATWSANSGDGSGAAVYSQLFNSAGERLGSQVLVNTTTASDQRNPVVTRVGTGYVVAWTSALQDGAQSGVYLQRFDANGVKLGSETLVNTTTANDQYDPVITTLSNGTFVVAWTASVQDGSSTGVYSQRFDANGVKLGGETLVNTTTLNFQEQPEVAALGTGYVVVWKSTESDGNGNDIVFQRFDASGNKLGAETKVETVADENVTSASVATLPGGFVVAWQGTDSSSNGVYIQRFDASGGKVGPQTLVHIDPAGAQIAPDVVALSGGGFVVVWQAFDSQAGRYEGYQQLFDASGQKIGIETQLPNASNSPQTALTVSALPTGGYVVSWETGTEVITHRFNADGSPVLPTLTGDEFPNILTATGANPVWLSGGAGNDKLTSGTGADWLEGGAGNDTLTGGAGDDTYIVDAGDRIVELDGGGIDTVRVSDSYTLTSLYVEYVVLTGTAAASLIGNSFGNVLVGNNADNSLNGGLGADRLYGGRGNDTYYVEDGALPGEDPASIDLVFEEADSGIDTVVSEIDYTLGSNVEILRLVGSAALSGTGNELHNQITGNAAANVLDGRAGNDVLAGEEGNDTYVVDAGDTVLESLNEGTDTVQSAGTWTLGANFENLTLTGSASVNATGNELANILTGNTGGNILDGGEGADVMNGGQGADTYYVDNAGDVASETLAGAGDIVLATVTHSLGAEIENLTLTGTAAINGTGNNLANVIRGNSAANILNGGFGADQLYGGSGNDTLISSDGLDQLYGGVGNDFYQVVGNFDQIVELSAQGTDTVTAAVTREYALGLNLENLILEGGNVNGYGNSLGNIITGTSGNNILDGGGGTDRLVGLAGNDTYVVDSAGEVIVEAAGQGTDQVLSSVSLTLAANLEYLTLTGGAAANATGNELANRLIGNDAANSLLGAAGGDRLIGGGGNDQMYGGAGNDSLVGGAGNDRLDGGDGVDEADYTATTGVTVNLALTTAQNTVAAGSDIILTVENVLGSSTGGDTLTGNTLANRLTGYGGDDVLAGAAGNDQLYGGEGADLILGDADNDLIDGGNGVDKLSFSAVAANITVDLNIASAQNSGAGLDTIRNIEQLEGSQTGNDRLVGDFGDNSLFGLGGNDVLAGGDGSDLLDGGAGTDTADYSGASGDVIVNLALGEATDDGSGEIDTLVAIENATGSEFDDYLIGNTGDNVLNGNLGVDILQGGTGNDTYGVDVSGDRIIEAANAGTDTVESSINYLLGTNLENLTLVGSTALFATGNSVDNVLKGNTLANTLNGAAGNDDLYGKAGNDTLQGGTGADDFFFDTALGATNVDKISDFSVADDSIQLSRAIFTGITANGVLASTAFVAGTAAVDAADRIIYNSATGQIFYDSDGTGAAAAVLFATVTAGTALTNADFIAF